MNCPNLVIEVDRSDGQRVEAMVGNESVTFTNST